MARLLKKAAMKWVKGSPMDAWDEATQSWLPDFFKGRIDIVDRFLSNFNKPTRRRMLYTDNEAVFPDSKVMRNPATSDVYIMGTTRTDALNGQAYEGVTILQLATDVPGGAAGLATYTRKVPLGPPDDPGWLVDSTLGQYYTDIEFRNSSDEKDTEDLKIENFLLYTSLNLELKAWDYVELKGKKYRMVDAFVDSGFTSGRIDEEMDTRMNFYLHVNGSQVYDRVAKKWVTAVRTYQVTGVMVRREDLALWSSEAESYIDVYFEAENIGVTPEPNLMSLEYNGVTKTIRHVSTQAGRRQWILRCN